MHLDTNCNLYNCTFYVYANSGCLAQCFWWDIVPQAFVFIFLYLKMDIQTLVKSRYRLNHTISGVSFENAI